jgi:hypothetical protein
MSTSIDITNDFMQLKEIKDAFNQKFPHLRIEFYSKGHNEGEGTSAAAIYDENLRLVDIRKEGKMGSINIHGNMKTSTMEAIFAEEFGIHIQVFRKSGNVWLQTTATDDWSLAEQEREAAEMN